MLGTRFSRVLRGSWSSSSHLGGGPSAIAVLSTTAASASPATRTRHDLLVIGCGSGGLATARRAAAHGAKVLIVEKTRPGGTCVNAGCVPKKVMFNAAVIRESLDIAKSYGFQVDSKDVQLNFQALKKARDAFITRLNGIYLKNLTASGVQYKQGFASFTSPSTVSIDGEVHEAKHIVIATGSAPFVPPIHGAELLSTSDGFFELEHVPRKAAIIGGGYIATEMAFILAALGAETHLILKDPTVLPSFDSMVRTEVMNNLQANPRIKLVRDTMVKGARRNAQGGIDLDPVPEGNFDFVLAATGRRALVKDLNIKAAGLHLEHDEPRSIHVDEFQNTQTPGVYALGDVTGRQMLTPVAIAAGRLLADRLFGGVSHARMDYDDVPTVVFAHPPVGVVGLTEEQAVSKFGQSAVRVYTSKFVNMWYGVSEHKAKTHMKLVCAGPTEKVVGIHMVGDSVDEILQGFAVAVKMGVTKAQLDSCVAIHPTAAEELVTMAPWMPSYVKDHAVKP